MADVRALLKAKRQEAKIVHPLASYGSSGQLRCAACGTIVKHASAWEGHVGSKAHRTNVARIREEEAVKMREEQERERTEEMARGKRKAEEQDEESEDEEVDVKKRRVEGSGFPGDFFSDPARAPLDMAGGEGDEDDETVVPVQPAPAEANSVIDLEYERFQREMLALAIPDKQETFARATVMAEAVIAEEQNEGFPPLQNQEEEEVVDKANLEVVRKEKEQEERELIMDRLLDEERAQEEADMKVTVMKNRLEALKKKRMVAKISKAIK